MALADKNELPMFKDPISAEQAAALYDLVFGKSTTVETFRTWLRENDDRVLGFVKKKVGDTGWIVDRVSMLDVFEAQADRMLIMVGLERAANEEEK